MYNIYKLKINPSILVLCTSNLFIPKKGKNSRLIPKYPDKHKSKKYNYNKNVINTNNTPSKLL